MQRSTDRLPLALPLCILLGLAACTAPRDPLPATDRATTLEGVVASIDTQPWAYDGHAVVEVEVPGRGRVAVQLPARWNLCQAAPVDVQALDVGMRVRAVGELDEDGRLTVCADPAHRLAPI